MQTIWKALTHLIFLSHVRFILSIILAIFLFLCLVPYGISKLPHSTDSPGSDTSHEADFETVEAPETITLYRTETGKTETIDFEDYVKGVVAGEMPSTFHLEALKAQAVAARTYSAARIINAEEKGNPEAHPDAALCDTTHCQVYRDTAELEELKGEEWMEDGWQKICSAVADTEGELLYYKGELVQQALFHSSSGGKTENSEDVFASAVPYLVSVESPYEDEATHQQETHSFSISEFTQAVKKSYPNISFGTIKSSNIEILSRSSGGSVEKMQVGSAALTGVQVRTALELPSANFTIEIKDNTITFTSNGSGHGVGMSQYGANGMAEKGYDYKDILSHYYSGTEVY